MVTLMILVGATWMGLYLAKRITRPVQMLAAAAREIGAGRLDQRVEPQSNDEFGSLVEAFNAWPASWRPAAATSSARRSSSSASTRSRRPAPLHRDDPRAHHDRRRLGRRRRARSPRSTARRRGCSASTRTVVGQPARDGVRRADLQPLGALLAGAGRGTRRAGRAGDRARARRPRAAPGRRGDAAASATAARRKAPSWCSTT